MDDFEQHLDKCSQICSQWPKWKQELLGGSAVRHLELTGKKRFRSGEGGTLVLQVQERWLETECISGNIDAEWLYRWRDAAISDITVFEDALENLVK